jgi:hypothetical protein
MAIAYQETSAGITRVGNYLISMTSEGKASLTPLLGIKNTTTWLEGEVICNNKLDAERIALVFTTQDDLFHGNREMMIRYLDLEIEQEKK